MPLILDNTQQHSLPTGRVRLSEVDGFTDRELADLAGYSSSHFGYSVSRDDEGNATVHLWND